MAKEETFALIIIDLSDEQIYTPNGAKIFKDVGNIVKLANALPQDRVFDVRLWLSEKDDTPLKELFPGEFMETNPKAQLAQEIAGKIKVTFVKKTQYSAFFETGLHEMLQDAGVTCVLLCGVHTDYCVFATALDAFNHRYKVLVVQDACATVSGPAGHRKGINDILRFLGSYAQIATTEQALKAIDAGSLEPIARQPQQL